ncbi:MAG: divalent metal cation transporter [Flavobacteriales bacterium]|nr:divalent metal cation transporter [Flavobacteriales bacterium]
MNRLLKVIGPGILFASTAIGVSHLVQSTRAGAVYGFGLLWAVVLANLMKYPFFEFGSRYANVSGTSIIDGYRKMGHWMFYAYVIVTIGSMFFVTAAVTAVTVGFLSQLFMLETFFEGANIMHTATIVLVVIISSVLMRGGYKTLDKLIKIIGSVLLITTLIAFVAVLIKGPNTSDISIVSPDIINDENAFFFVIALMGWMPTAVDLSTWNSLWTLERIKETGYRPKLKETLLDFNTGYLISALLSICFITLGAFLIYGTTEEMPAKSGAFAGRVISLYTEVMGGWSKWLISAAGFSIMFGTCIAVFDGYARSAEKVGEIIFTDSNKELNPAKAYRWCIFITAIITMAIVIFAGGNLKSLVDLATTISFIIAPVIAGANLYLVTKGLGKEGHPPTWLRILAYFGVAFLTVFSVIYLLALS